MVSFIAEFVSRYQFCRKGPHAGRKEEKKGKPPPRRESNDDTGTFAGRVEG